MEWLALATLILLLVIVRRLILIRWRTYRWGHRRTAFLYATVMPVVFLILALASGVAGVERGLLIVGIALVIFASTYGMMLFFLMAMGGEWDPPASSSYKKRM